MDILSRTADEIYSNDALYAELDRVYFNIFKQHPTRSCKNCIADALFQIKYHLKNTTMAKKIEEKKPCAFKLKSSAVLWIPKLHMHITNSNLTDELAIKVIKISRGTLKYFEEVPKNLPELLHTEPVFSEPPTGDEPVKDNEPVKENDIPTVDELVAKHVKAELIDMAKNYPSPIRFSESDTKRDIAKAIVNRMIIDADI